MKKDLKPEWQMKTYVDSDWTGDTESRKSVTGWCMFVDSCLIGWGPREQTNIAQSSIESEFIGITDICKEILYVKQIMEFLGENIEYPIIINVDNQGAIWMAKNG